MCNSPWWPRLLIAAAALFGAPALADDPGLSWPKCSEHKGEPSIAACTAQITSGVLPVPVLAVAHFFRGFAYADQHQREQALADYEETIRLDASLAGVHINRGNIYYDLRDYPRALADYSEAIRLHPTDKVAFNNRCFVHLRSGNVEKAMADCNEAIRLGPDYVNAYRGRALAFLAQGDGARALADEDLGVLLEPTAWSHINRGAARFILGRDPEAVSDLTEAAKMNPTNANALLWLHLTLVRSGVNDHDILLHKADKVPRTGWPGAMLGFYLGEVPLEQARAAATQGQAESQADRVCEAAFFIGEDALLRNDQATAIPLLRQAAAGADLNLFPRAAAVAELRRLSQ